VRKASKTTSKSRDTGGTGTRPEACQKKHAPPFSLQPEWLRNALLIREPARTASLFASGSLDIAS